MVTSKNALMRLNETFAKTPCWARLLGLSAASLLLMSLGNLIRGDTTGRGWIEHQYFFNYQDLGFVKRGVIGSALKTLVDSPGECALVVSFFATALVLALAYWGYFLRNTQGMADRPRLGLAILFLLSPATFFHLGYDLGRFDLHGLVISLLVIVAARSGYFFFGSLLCALAILIHEAFFFMFFPILLCIMCFEQARRSVKTLRAVSVALIPTLAALILVLLFGKYEPGYDALRSYFIEHISEPHLGALSVLTRGSAENVMWTLASYLEMKRWADLVLGFAYLFFFARFFFQFHRLNGLQLDLLSYSPFASLALFVFGSDFFRWIALLVINMSVVLVYKLSQRAVGERAEIVLPGERVILFLILPSLLGPIGSTRLFPLVNGIIKSLMSD